MKNQSPRELQRDEQVMSFRELNSLRRDQITYLPTIGEENLNCAFATVFFAMTQCSYGSM